MTRLLAARLGGLVATLAVLACFCGVAGATSSSVATVPVGAEPHGVAVDPSTGKVYVTNSNSSTVSVIDGATNQVTATIGAGNTPEGVAVDAVTDRIYVANDFSSSVWVIDGATNTVIARILVGGQPLGVAVDPSTDEIYVTDTVNLNHNSVTVINGVTNTVITSLTTGRLPFAVAVDPSTHRAYVANLSDNTVSVIDGASHQVIATIPVGKGPTGVAVDPSTHKVYVANGSDTTVSVIDGTTNHVVATVEQPAPGGVAVDPAINRLYVLNGNLTVSVLDETSYQLIATVPVGSGPFDIAVNTATHKVYVADYFKGTVSVFTSPGVKLQDLSVGAGSEPTGVVYEPGSDQVFGALGGSNKVVAIGSASTCGATASCSSAVVPGFGSTLQFPESLGLLGGLVLASNFHAPAGDAVAASPDTTFAGAPVSPITFNVPGCKNPAGVAGVITGNSGAVWVACPGSGKLGEVSASGGTVVVALPLAGALPSGVTADPTTAGAVLVADARHDKLYIYTSPSVTPSAAQTATLKPGCAPAYAASYQPTAGAGHPTDVYVACPGTSDIELVQISAAGTFTGTPASFTAGGTPVPTRDYGIAANGSTLVATGSGSSDAYIYTLLASGAPSAAVHVTSLPAGSIPDGVAIAGSEAYIADEGTGQISVIDPPAAPALRRPALVASAARAARSATLPSAAAAVRGQLARGEPLIAPRLPSRHGLSATRSSRAGNPPRTRHRRLK